MIEVYVRPFPDADSGLHPISTNHDRTADGAPGTIVVGDVVGLRACIAGTESTRLTAPAIALGQ